MVDESNISRAIRIDANLAGQRIDKAAAMLLPEFSRTQLVEWVRDGSLTLDGRVVPAKQRVFGGEALVLNAASPLQARWDVPQAVPFRRVFEDEALLVVDKPAGVVVHPGAGNPDHTLVNGLLQILPASAQLAARRHRASARQGHERLAGGREIDTSLAAPHAGVVASRCDASLPRRRRRRADRRTHDRCTDRS